jgi:hypothetical protein
MDRREFVSALAILGASAPAAAEPRQVRPEVENYWADVPSGATFWALAVFLADEPLELTVGAGTHVQTVRGRFDGQRLQELSWRNDTGATQHVAVRARALAEDRELPPSKVQFISEQHVYVAFGRRGIPEKAEDRHGSYPYDAVFVGFVTFGN